MDSSQAPVTTEQQGAQQQLQAPAATETRQSQEALEQFQRLMQRENMLRKREAGISELQKKAERLDKILSAFESGDVDTGLSEFGLDYDKLTSKRLGSIGNESDRKLAQIEKAVEAINKRFENEDGKRANEEQTRAYQQVENEVKELVDGSEDFELIKALGMHDMVLQTAAEVYQSTGRSIDIKEAAKEVELFFEKRLENILQAKKVATRLGQQSSKPEQAGEQAQQPTKTLSNELGQEARTEQIAMTQEELFERAMRRLKG